MRHGKKLGIDGPFLARAHGAVVGAHGRRLPRASDPAPRRWRAWSGSRRSASARPCKPGEFRGASSRSPAGLTGPADVPRLRAAPTPSGSTTPTACPSTSPRSSPRTAASPSTTRASSASSRRSRSARAQASKMGAVKGDPVYLKLARERARPTFLGYDAPRAWRTRRCSRCSRTASSATRLDAGEEGGIVLDRTPFYGESGGQVGDHGVIAADGSAAEVTDCHASPFPASTRTTSRSTAGGFERGHDRARRGRREPARAAPCATTPAPTCSTPRLRETLGPHVKQAGSLVAPDRLRFDFSHYARRSAPRAAPHREPRQRRDPEGRGARREGHGPRGGARLRRPRLLRRQVRRAGARGRGPRASPRSSAAAPTSTGTGEIGLFLFTSEQGVSAGTRRVEALAGEAAMERAQRRPGHPRGAGGSRPRSIARALVDEYAKLREQLKAREREIQALKMKLATGRRLASRAGSDLVEVGGVQVWTPRFEGLDKQGPRRGGGRLPQPQQGPAVRPRLFARSTGKACTSSARSRAASRTA